MYVSSTTLAVLSVIPVVLVYVYRLVKWYRLEQFKDTPRLKPDPIWGHLKDVGDAMKAIPAGGHSDYAWEELHKRQPNASMLALDMRPVLAFPLTIVYSHAIAEQCSKVSKLFRYSTPKSPTMDTFLEVIGTESILRQEGEKWRSLRKRFNPGFAPTHLITLLPTIVDKTERFLKRLDVLSQSGEVFEFEDLCTSLTFDIIGAVVLDVDLGAQLEAEKRHPIVKVYRELLVLYEDDKSLGWWEWITNRSNRKAIGKRTDTEIKKTVIAKFEELKKARADDKPLASGRSILELSLQDIEIMTPQILQETADSVKTFLFAGHDTTSSLLQWIFYSLSIHPQALATLTQELDSVFGPDTSPEDVASQLLERGEEALQKLSYTSAVIKEALRLFPPAGSARIAPKGSGFTVQDPDTGVDMPLEGMVIYLDHYSIQRDPKVFGETASLFIPDRWVGDSNTSQESDEAPSNSKANYPSSAWRAFERGPRNCIGQELANLEARVILACAVRRYNFEKVGFGEVLINEKGVPEKDENGVLKVKSEMFNKRQITSKPVDGMKMRVSFAKKTGRS